MKINTKHKDQQSIATIEEESPLTSKLTEFDLEKQWLTNIVASDTRNRADILIIKRRKQHVGFCNIKT